MIIQSCHCRVYVSEVLTAYYLDKGYTLVPTVVLKHVGYFVDLF